MERLAGQEERVPSGMAFSSQNRLSRSLVLLGEPTLATPSMTSLKTKNTPCLILPPVPPSSSHCLLSRCSNRSPGPLSKLNRFGFQASQALAAPAPPASLPPPPPRRHLAQDPLKLPNLHKLLMVSAEVPGVELGAL